MTPCVVLVDQRLFVLREQFDCGASSLLYIYVCDYYGSCCELGLRHFACDIPLKLNGILGQSHLYFLWSWQWGCYSWTCIYAWSGSQFFCPSRLVGQGCRGWSEMHSLCLAWLRYLWCVWPARGGHMSFWGLWVFVVVVGLNPKISVKHTCVMVCPVQAHSKLNAKIGKRVISLNEV